MYFAFITLCSLCKLHFGPASVLVNNGSSYVKSRVSLQLPPAGSRLSQTSQSLNPVRLQCWEASPSLRPKGQVTGTSSHVFPQKKLYPQYRGSLASF